MNGLTKAAQDVLAERQRQIEREGWTPEHDDEHRGGAMATAAAAYCVAGEPSVLGETAAKLWPWTGWARAWFKPKDRRHNLIRAAALLLAEIERLDRLEARKSTAPAMPFDVAQEYELFRSLASDPAMYGKRLSKFAAWVELHTSGVGGTFNDQQEKGE